MAARPEVGAEMMGSKSYLKSMHYDTKIIVIKKSMISPILCVRDLMLKGVGMGVYLNEYGIHLYSISSQPV